MFAHFPHNRFVQWARRGIRRAASRGAAEGNLRPSVFIPSRTPGIREAHILAGYNFTPFGKRDWRSNGHSLYWVAERACPPPACG